MAIYGTSRGGHGIENLNSDIFYADIRLGPYAGNDGFLGYELGADGINYSISGDFLNNLFGTDAFTGGIRGTLTTLGGIEMLGDQLDQFAYMSQLLSNAQKNKNPEVTRCIREAQLEFALEVTSCVLGTVATDSEEFLPACIKEVARGLTIAMAACAARQATEGP